MQRVCLKLAVSSAKGPLRTKGIFFCPGLQYVTTYGLSFVAKDTVSENFDHATRNAFADDRRASLLPGADKDSTKSAKHPERVHKIGDSHPTERSGEMVARVTRQQSVYSSTILFFSAISKRWRPANVLRSKNASKSRRKKRRKEN